MSIGAWVITVLRNNGVASRVRADGKVLLSGKITSELRAMVKKHSAEVAAELRRWPRGEAPARNPLTEPLRRDERGREPKRPQALFSRLPWTRRGR